MSPTSPNPDNPELSQTRSPSLEEPAIHNLTIFHDQASRLQALSASASAGGGRVEGQIEMEALMITSTIVGIPYYSDTIIYPPKLYSNYDEGPSIMFGIYC